MATLVLTAVGSAVGGPIGGALGAALGGAIDRTVLFRPPGREGPRLKELALQTSSYGTEIPKLYGRIRVAGSVIWATDLIEHRSTGSSGKGQPSTTRYSYTASFAVALSARPIQGVRRIWAEGKLLRGAAGDLKSRTGFRLHRGGEDQLADPLIGAAEGAGLAPAHRGTAYAVFENMDLEPFGNRIPALTFEVEADAGAVGIGVILDELAPEVLASDAELPELLGFSAHGASVRAVAEVLAGAANGWFREGDRTMVLTRGGGPASVVADGAAGERAARAIAAADKAPRSLTLTHYDPARDFQIGVQRAQRPGAGTRESRVELPAVLDAGAARTLASEALARMELERERRRVTLGWDALALAPGGRVRIAGVPGLWRIERWTLEAMRVRLGCVRVAPAALPMAASGGRVAAAPDDEIGVTVLQAFELPPLEDAPASGPLLAIAAAGTGAGWRSAALLTSIDGGARWDSAGSTGLTALLGTITVPPGGASAMLEDRTNILEVTLMAAGMTLGDADAAALDAGANLAIAGSELLQFARAEPLGGARWRLSGLWRGRRGTEYAIATQAVGDPFVCIAADALRVVSLGPETIGGALQVLAQGPGDAVAVAASAPIDGRSILPPAPAHLRVEPLPDGSVRLRWIRRSRTGWRWVDGVDAPLAEERERYRVTVAPSAAPARIEETDQPTLMLSAADCSAGCHVSVRQVGTHGLSRPAERLVQATGEGR
ncbi:phage tail protein [Sphingosinithalassobacter sp. LHW66-3]|uniref:phage tail protein n=1 Tax=Sphingosinithalassobacter sp. LHW66-3 TaxID=3424718 RepID=UPI003D6A4E87